MSLLLRLRSSFRSLSLSVSALRRAIIIPSQKQLSPVPLLNPNYPSSIGNHHLSSSRSFFSLPQYPEPPYDSTTSSSACFCYACTSKPLFPNLELLKQHNIEFHPELTFECFRCGSKFGSARRLGIHIGSMECILDHELLPFSSHRRQLCNRFPPLIEHIWYSLTPVGKNYKLVEIIQRSQMMEGCLIVIVVDFPLRAVKLKLMLSQCGIQSALVHPLMSYDLRSRVLKEVKSKVHNILVLSRLNLKVDIGEIDVTVDFDAPSSGYYSISEFIVEDQFVDGSLTSVVHFKEPI